MSTEELMLSVERSTDPAKNLEREDGLFNLVDSGELPALIRFWVNTECLIRGKVRHKRYGWYNEELASELGVPVYERSTGGGVVYNDEGNLNWSVFLRTSGRYLSPVAGFEKGSQRITTALQDMGVAARFAPPNRIEVRGKKVSGMAARSTKHTMLVHGTLLISSNLKRLNELCLPPSGCPPVSNLNEFSKAIRREDVIASVERSLGGVQLRVNALDNSCFAIPSKRG
jgi:lipoate---protein ligase